MSFIAIFWIVCKVAAAIALLQLIGFVAYLSE
jgi:hypothetical protein